MDSTAAHRYHAYLLRLWQTGDDEAVEWRASLEDPHTGERRGFADLNSLFTFLNEVAAQPTTTTD